MRQTLGETDTGKEWDALSVALFLWTLLHRVPMSSSYITDVPGRDRMLTASSLTSNSVLSLGYWPLLMVSVDLWWLLTAPLLLGRVSVYTVSWKPTFYRTFLELFSCLWLVLRGWASHELSKPKRFSQTGAPGVDWPVFAGPVSMDT